MNGAAPSSDLAVFSPAFLDAVSALIFLIGLKFSAREGPSEAGFALRDPKKAEGLATRDTDAVR